MTTTYHRPRGDRMIRVELPDLDGDRWLDPDEAAAYVGMTPSGLAQAGLRISGPARHKVKGFVFYKASELDAWKR